MPMSKLSPPETVARTDTKSPATTDTEWVVSENTPVDAAETVATNALFEPLTLSVKGIELDAPELETFI